MLYHFSESQSTLEWWSSLSRRSTYHVSHFATHNVQWILASRKFSLFQSLQFDYCSTCSSNREKITHKVILQVIGWNYMNLYSLRVNTEGYTTDYDATCNPGIFNEFSTAAFRFGHSLIRPMLTRVSSNFKEMDSHIRLRDGFFNPDMLYESKMIDEVKPFYNLQYFHSLKTPF